jgi:GNAT superfamily N-acetyltransferase
VENLASSLEIRFIKSFTAPDKLLLAGGEKDSSGTNSYGLEWRPTEHHVLVMKNGRSVSHVGFLKHAVRVGERVISVAGIGGVLTHPMYRGLGFARMAIEEALRQAVHQLNVQFGLLFCREAMLPWYERQGWMLAQDTVWIEQWRGIIPSPLPAMIQCLAVERWPAGEVWLGSLPW